MGREKRGFEVLKQPRKGPGQRLPPRDENIVIAGKPIKGKHSLGCLLQPPSGTVPLDRRADLAARSESDPDRLA